MFDAFGGAEEVAPDAPKNDGIDQRHDLPKAEVLALEHEVLGFYLSGHPLEERAGLVSLLSSCPIRNLDKLSQNGGGEVRIAGLVLQKAELVVKSDEDGINAKMCRFRLEDLSGSVSVTCFPRTYADARDIIEDGAVLLVKGKLEEGSDEPAILLDDVFSLSDALSRFRGGLGLRVEPSHRPRSGPQGGLRPQPRREPALPPDHGRRRHDAPREGQPRPGCRHQRGVRDRALRAPRPRPRGHRPDLTGPGPGPQSPPVFAAFSKPARIRRASSPRAAPTKTWSWLAPAITLRADPRRRERGGPAVSPTASRAVVVFRVIQAASKRTSSPAARARSRGCPRLCGPPAWWPRRRPLRAPSASQEPAARRSLPS